MIKLIQKIQIPTPSFQITHENRIISIGSCFAESVGKKMQSDGFDIEVNPFGTIYNPISIGHILNRTVQSQYFTKKDVFCNQGIWRSYDLHSKLRGHTEKGFITLVNSELERIKAHLESCNVFILTLGTAYVWRLRENDRIVANCHKMPNHLFRRERLKLNEVISGIDNIINLLKSINPDFKIITTVSPVRHLRDGAIENNKSKSTLILALDEIQREDVYYFPSYEIQMDELRDYRYYARDLAHPNELAVEIIYDKFKNVFFNQSTLIQANIKNKELRRTGHIEKF